MKPFTTILLILWSGITFGQNSHQSLDSLFQTQYWHGQLHANVMVAKDGQVLYQRSFGDQDIARHIPNSDATVFSLASVSKTFTATAMLQLMEKGKFKLDDPVVRYLQDFPYPLITIRQLLAHTSGLPDKEVLFTDSVINLQPDKVWQNKDILPALWKFGKLKLAPGEKWSYSNINYALLAMLIEKFSGLSFDAYLKRYVFKPAGIKDAYLRTSLMTGSSSAKAINYAFAAPYETELKPVSQLPGTRKWIYLLSGFVGHGGLVMSAADLYRFDQALYNGKLLKHATLNLAFAPTILNNGTFADASSSAGKASYGLGWFIMNDTTAGKIVFHTGRQPGEVNIFLRNLAKRETVIVLDNAESEALYTTGVNAMKILDNRPQQIRKFSIAIYYSKALFKDGSDAAASKLAAFRADSANYELDPGEIDFMGHAFLERGRNKEALEIFRNNLLLYPNIWQVYNSYAAALIKDQNETEAKSIFKLALQLNPEDEEALKALRKLK